MPGSLDGCRPRRFRTRWTSTSTWLESPPVTRPWAWMTVPQTNEAEAGGPGMISSARASVQLIADRSDLWVPGALATLAFLGWLPLVLALAAPTAGDVAFFATSLVTASNFPLNVVLLGAFIV